MKTMGERLAVLETKVTDMSQRMDRQFNENKDTNDRIEKKLDDFISSADKKYAPSWVTWAVKGALAGAVTGLLGILIFMIQRHII